MGPGLDCVATWLGYVALLQGRVDTELGYYNVKRATVPLNQDF